MNRLTQTDDIGNWSLEGLPWKDTYVGQVITKNTSEKIYAALCKLKDYEDTVLTPNQVQELKERGTAKRLNEICGAFGEKYECPNCGSSLRDIDALAGYCKWCGQRVEV